MTLSARWLEDRALQAGRLLVPADLRAEWLRSWQAELWYERRRGRNDLSLGLLRDALWLRFDRWRQALMGTALLCLLLLLVLAGAAALPVTAFVLEGSLPRNLPIQLLPRFAIASGLTLFVSYATSFATVSESHSGHGRRWLRTSTFHTAKVLLLLLAAALLSTDVCLPLEMYASFAAMPLELLAFVFLTLLGLRWNFLDSQARCKQCLRCLAPPQRVGRPSWNFLDYNGTELACLDGHGLLTVPELETSWCRSSAWVSQQA